MPFAMLLWVNYLLSSFAIETSWKEEACTKLCVANSLEQAHHQCFYMNTTPLNDVLVARCQYSTHISRMQCNVIGNFISQTPDRILKCDTLGNFAFKKHGTKWNFILKTFRVIGKNKFLRIGKLL